MSLIEGPEPEVGLSSSMVVRVWVSVWTNDMRR